MTAVEVDAAVAARHAGIPQAGLFPEPATVDRPVQDELDLFDDEDR